MKVQVIAAVYIFLLGADFLVSWFLDILNINSVIKNKDKIPEFFKDFIDTETYKKSSAYTLRKQKFTLLVSVKEILILLIILASGAAGILENFISNLTENTFLRSFLYLTAAGGILSLIGFPESLYSIFVIEEEFGFNKQIVKTFFADMAKSVPLGLALLAILLLGLHGAIRIFGNYWWLAGWAFWILLQLILVVIYPVLIAPLFNKFTPLEEGSLKERLSALAEKSNFPNKGIFVMDGSRRSAHSNAYFTGFGKLKRIVIFDTLINSLEEEELEAVLAHEIGHWKHGHIRKMILFSFFSSLILFYILSLIFNFTPFYNAFGVKTPSLHTLLFILSFFIMPLSSLFSPLSNIFSRKYEYQADKFAVNAAGNYKPLSNALLKLSRDNLSNLTPHPAYSFWHYSHPALSERIKAMKQN